MPQMVVAFWNCTKSEHWSETSFQKRITSLYAATFTAQMEVDSKMGKQARVSTWIFTAPEYTFAQDQVSLTSKTQVKAALSQITSEYGSLLLIPGTIAVKDGGNYAQNLCYVYRNGAKICSFGKKNGVGEVSEGSGLTFSGGQGYGTFTLDAVEYGVQICKDATTSGVVLPSDIDVHVVVGQGVGFTAIPKKAKRYLIVADSLGNHAVYNYAAGSEQIKPYKKETSLGEDIYYFLINL
jgi:hypothetical protein